MKAIKKSAHPAPTEAKKWAAKETREIKERLYKVREEILANNVNAPGADHLAALACNAVSVLLSALKGGK